MRARKSDRSSGPAGFTLVELLIVVAVIAVLATLVVPSFDHYRHKAAIAAAQATAHCLETGFTTFDLNSADPVERLPEGIDSQLSLIEAGNQVGCKMGSTAAGSALASSPVFLIDCQMIVVCPDGRVINHACNTNVCGPGGLIRGDYFLTLGVPRYADTIVISSREPMQTRFATPLTPPTPPPFR